MRPVAGASVDGRTSTVAKLAVDRGKIPESALDATHPLPVQQSPPLYCWNWYPDPVSSDEVIE
jgi:hypothetical protein